jgi:hypothetical protein
MRPVRRAALTAATLVVATLVALTFRSLNAYGVFTDVTPGFAGTCTAIPIASGPEDIAIDKASGLAFISSMDRRAFASGKPSAQDGLYVMALVGPAHPVKLAGAPSVFHPHGIALVRDAGGLVLLAINHRKDGTSSIETFTVALKPTVKLVNIGSVEGAQLTSPNAIVAVDRQHFYVANDHGGSGALDTLLEDILVFGRGDVLYYDGILFHEVADHLAFASGLALSPDGRHLYVTETNARRLDSYLRNPVSGQLDSDGTLEIPSGVDNVHFDDAGGLWVGSHPKGLAMAAFRSHPDRPAPSEIFKVSLDGAGVPQSASVVYANMGEQIGGSAGATVTGNRMLIGGPLTDHLLDCRMAH